MDCKELYTLIELPDEIVKKLEHIEIGLTQEQMQRFSKAMRTKETFEETSSQLKDLFSEDKNGYKMLKLLLSVACDAYAIYCEKGIPKKIFAETMKCFTRFTKEHKESFGEYGFDRSFWVGRQLSLLLFRIGELEFELNELDDKNAVSIHIPSDSDLSKSEESLKMAKEFLEKYYPNYADGVYYCFTWLLSPALEGLLPPSSRIRLFRKCFTVTKYDEESEFYKQWVYKRKDIAPVDFPEDTSLQRNIKKYVLAGGHIGEGFGLLNI